MPQDGKGGPVALIESFTRFQLAAIIDSAIHRFIGSGGWAGWAGCLACWLAAGCWQDGEGEGFQGRLTRSTLWRGRRISTSIELVDSRIEEWPLVDSSTLEHHETFRFEPNPNF